MSIKEKIAENIDSDETAGDVVVLKLDDATSGTVEDIKSESEFTSLEFLTLNNCNLVSLKGFPKLPELVHLELMKNKINFSDGFVGSLIVCPRLEFLRLDGNLIERVEDLEPLKDLPKLSYLSIRDCPLASSDTYRDAVFEYLPQIVVLDGYDRDGEFIDDSGDDEEDFDDTDEEESADEVGLSYLQSSTIEDEDESEDFIPKEDRVSADNGNADNNKEENDGDAAAEKKRKVEQNGCSTDGPPAAKEARVEEAA